MHINIRKQGKISKEVLVQIFMEKLYEKGEINSGTYFNAITLLKEEKEYVNKQ